MRQLFVFDKVTLTFYGLLCLFTALSYQDSRRKARDFLTCKLMPISLLYCLSSSHTRFRYVHETLMLLLLLLMFPMTRDYGNNESEENNAYGIIQQ